MLLSQPLRPRYECEAAKRLLHAGFASTFSAVQLVVALQSKKRSDARYQRLTAEQSSLREKSHTFEAEVRIELEAFKL